VNDEPTGDELTDAVQALRAVALRGAVAARMEADSEQRLLQSIVDATLRLFDAEAASIALFEPDPDRLEFRVAAGPQGAGAIGKSVKPSQGIAGFVFSTGQALALSDVASDPRFDRSTAERTGYLPRSLAAVPLVDEGGAHGVLQVLDKRSSPTFSLRDMELLAVFATQAATAIAAARVQRDLPTLLRSAIGAVANGSLSSPQIDALATAAADLDRQAELPFWTLVDHVSSVRNLGERELSLLADILSVVAIHGARAPRRR